MSLTEGFVSGWVPSYGDNDDDVDIRNFAYPIKVPHDFHSAYDITLSPTSSDDSHSQYLSSLPFDLAPPSPGSSVDHTDVSYTDASFIPPLSSSDRRAIRNRMRDPEWVPRPRNAFIIFRCEYSRKHARDPSDSSDKPSRSDKTLSKRAGEEWRRLSAADREQYKILAEQEKAAHALQNPDYRFKPVRRPPPGMAPSAARGRLGTCRRTDRSAQVASLIMRSERGTSSFVRHDDHEDQARPEPAVIQVSSTTSMAGRRRSASMPQPVAVAAQKAVIPGKTRTPVPISCMSSPGPTALDLDMFSSSEKDDSPLYTPDLSTSPMLHGLPSGSQMLPLPEHPSHPSPVNQTFECGVALGGTQVRTPLSASCPVLTRSWQNCSAHVGATSEAYTYSNWKYDQYQQFTFADGHAYPSSLEMMTPYTDWSCGAPTESCLAIASMTGPLPKSQDTGEIGSFDPTPLSLPLPLQHESSVVYENPAAFWDASHAEAANGAAMLGGASGLTACFSEALPAGYDVVACI